MLHRSIEANVASLAGAVEAIGALRVRRRRTNRSFDVRWPTRHALHWVLDVTFKDGLARVRKGHGAKNMAVVRHFAINILRQAKDKIKREIAKKACQMGSRLPPKPHLIQPR